MGVSEVATAREVTNWLKIDGWDVYEEVALGYTDSLDILAIRGPILWAIEVKQTFSVALVGQAKRWIPHAHCVSVAVPFHKRGSASEGAVWICSTLGLGLLYATSNNVQQRVKPEFRRRVDADFLRKHVNIKQQDGSVPAGSASIARWTPWRLTVSELIKVVNDNPGVTLKEALKRMRHHYRTDSVANSSLSKYLRNGLIKELRLEPGFKLYPAHKP